MITICHWLGSKLQYVTDWDHNFKMSLIGIAITICHWLRSWLQYVTDWDCDYNMSLIEIMITICRWLGSQLQYVTDWDYDYNMSLIGITITICHWLGSLLQYVTNWDNDYNVTKRDITRSLVPYSKSMIKTLDHQTIPQAQVNYKVKLIQIPQALGHKQRFLKIKVIGIPQGQCQYFQVSMSITMVYLRLLMESFSRMLLASSKFFSNISSRFSWLSILRFVSASTVTL